jgi:predicted HD phosphohydrolase
VTVPSRVAEAAAGVAAEVVVEATAAAAAATAAAAEVGVTRCLRVAISLHDCIHIIYGGGPKLYSRSIEEQFVIAYSSRSAKNA